MNAVKEEKTNYLDEFENGWRGYSQSDFDATYSPEDDKLRIYAATRLSAEDWAYIKALGFRWAPKQDLFFTTWSPKREDFCLELCGKIDAEQMTLAERAEARAERFEGYALSNRAKSGAFHAAADRLSQRFYMGQPILVGHHSERSARRDKKRVDSSMRNSVIHAERVNYWNYRATGVERHANMKSSSKTRANRIKTLLAELRSHQRIINHGYILFEYLDKIDSMQGEKRASFVCNLVGSRLASGPTCDFETWSKLNSGEITTDEAIAAVEKTAETHAYGTARARVITHLLNRLGFERSELGEVGRYEGDLTPVIIQGFARTHGTDKPSAEKTERGFKLVSRVPLPLHLGDGCELELSDDEWRDLMQSCGYAVIESARKISKKASMPIMNFKCDSLVGQSRSWQRDTEVYTQTELSKTDWAKIHKDYKGTRLSSCGKFRFRIALLKDPKKTNSSFNYTWQAVFISDQKAHEIPDSDAVTRLPVVA